MASNFDQKTMLEGMNKQTDVEVSTGGKIVFYALFILLIPIFIFVSWRNWFRRTREEAIEQLSNIDSKLVERFDALENQLNVAKAALAQEKDIYTEVTRLRAGMQSKDTDPSSLTKKSQEINQLASRFNVVLENYPNIQSMPMMQQLMKTVKDLESDLEATRRYYNAVGRKYNSALASYPRNVAAASVKVNGQKIKRLALFEAEDNKRSNVSLKF
jgi:LemA protein